MTQETSQHSAISRIGAWRVDPALCEISKDGNTLKLEPREMQLLLYLAARPGRVVSVEQLLEQVWSGVVVTSSSVYQAVASLRRSLGDDTREPTYIANVPRRGYRLVAPVTEWVDAPDRAAEPVPQPAVPPAGAAVPRAVADTGAAAGSRARRAAVVLSVVLLAALGYIALDKLWLSKVGTLLPWSAARSPAADKSIAILPFVDMSERHDQEYFADGMSEELLDLVAQVPDLKVPARTSCFYFKNKQATVSEIAKALGVAHVLEGSVRKSGNTMRVTVQLIRADNGYHLWSHTYDRDLSDIFKVQDEIAAAVVEALKVKLVPAQLVSSHRTANTEAYLQFLLGRQFWNRGTLDGFRRSVEAYDKAVALDPHYAAAYARLAISEAYLADDTGDAAGMQRANAAAEQAVALAPDEADGYAARADLRASFIWDWTGAQADLAKALAIDPSDSEVQHRYAFLLANLGRLPEAIAAQRKAIELDPLSSHAWENLGRYQMFNKDFVAADEAMRHALEIQPDSPFGLHHLGALQLLEGNAAQALATFHKVDDEAFRLYGTSMAEYSLGHATESTQTLAELTAKHGQEAAYQIAEVHAWRGEKDEAFEWLNRAYQQRDGGLSDIKVNLLIASLHGDPRFGALVQKMNLPQ
jgi:TolB-like protein/DNA-binding winged helix-turn-helix (wHTH) protein/Tfp pilus assembly protein PilF